MSIRHVQLSHPTFWQTCTGLSYTEVVDPWNNLGESNLCKCDGLVEMRYYIIVPCDKSILTHLRLWDNGTTLLLRIALHWDICYFQSEGYQLALHISYFAFWSSHLHFDRNVFGCFLHWHIELNNCIISGVREGSLGIASGIFWGWYRSHVWGTSD